MSSNRVGALDGWRGISISLVLAGHLLPLGPKAWNLNVAVAGAGMAIFFTLSGCLITSVLLRDPDVRNFLIRRLMRIVPLAWLGSIVTLAATGAGADTYLPHLLFYANTGPMWLTTFTGHYWSLCVEVQFYVMIALLTLALGQRSLRILPVLAVLVTLYRWWHHKEMAINTQYRIDEILAGCTLALVLDRHRAVDPIRYIWLAPAIGLPLLVLSAHPAGGFLYYLRPYIAALTVGCTLFAARDTVTARALSSRLLAYLAKISYALYIIHGCIMFSWLGTGSTTLVKYAKRPFLFLLTFGLAHLSTKYYESWFIDLGKRWTRGRADGRPLIPALAADTPRPSSGRAHPSILIVSEHASTRFGGEAALAFHYFRVMRARGLDVRLMTHARVRDELLQAFPGESDRLLFVEDTALQRLMWRLGKFLPRRIATFTTGFASRIITQRSQVRRARELVEHAGIQIIHQPMPVSPREPSLMHGLGAPVVIGPLNGNMTYPPGFRADGGPLVSAAERLGRAASGVMNALFPGKREAAAILVANHRTAEALPQNLRGRVLLLPENGVDLSLWRPDEAASVAPAPGPTCFIYMGRLVDWKAVDLLVHAFHRAAGKAEIALTIIGDGPEFAPLQALARSLGLMADQPRQPGRIFFAGWLSQRECASRLRDSDALVLPSLWECGGAVVLEAMASKLPVIATAWGGPLDYLDARSGVLVTPTSREHLIDGFAAGMVTLAADPQLRAEMGEAARRRIEADFDWERKVDHILALYHDLLHEPTGVSDQAWAGASL